MKYGSWHISEEGNWDWFFCYIWTHWTWGNGKNLRTHQNWRKSVIMRHPTVQSTFSRKLCCGPGSGSISTRYGSGSFYHHAKVVGKTLVSTVLWLLYDFLAFKNDVNVSSKSSKHIKLFLKLIFEVRIRIRTKMSRTRKETLSVSHLSVAARLRIEHGGRNLKSGAATSSLPVMSL